MGSELTQTPIAALLLTVFNSILQVFLLCLAGYLLAGKGILDKKTQKQINRLNVTLFTPALLFSKVAFFLSPEKLRELWVVPLVFVVVTAVSMGVSFTLSWIFGLKRSQRSFAMAAAMFMNSNSLPIALMQSLVVSVSGLQWGEDDNQHAMLGRALTYLVLFSTFGMVLRWSYGVRLLSQSDEESEAEEIVISSEETPLLADDEYDDFAPISESEQEDLAPHATLRPPPRRRTTYYRSFPNSPGLVPTLPSAESGISTPALISPLASDGEETDEEDARYSRSPLPIHGTLRAPKPHRTSLKRRIRRTWAAFTEFMTMPLWAALASIIVACVHPFQHALEEHLLAVKGALSTAGNCSIPLTLVVLGAYFYPAPALEPGAAAGHATTRSTDTLVHNIKDFLRFKRYSTTSSRYGDEYGARSAEVNPGETKTVVIAVLSRMVITPLLLMPLVALSAKFDWHRVFEDPVFIVVNVLLVSSPPAVTLAQITQAASGDAFERLISRTIFWSYCVLTPPATIFYVVLGLVFAKL